MLRANNKELQLVQRRFSNIILQKPDNGYDILDYSQSPLIEDVVRTDILPLLD